MIRATLNSLWSRKLRLLMSAFSIVLGVAFVAGSFMFTDLLSAGFDQILKGTVADVNVSPNDARAMNARTATLSEQTLTRITELDGVEHAEGVVVNYQIYPLDKDGRLVAYAGAPGIGANWHNTPAAGGQAGARIIEGRPPENAREVVIDPVSVQRAGYTVGDQVRISTPRDGVRQYRLVGTATYGAGSTAGANYVFFTLPEIRSIGIAGGTEGYSGAWIQTEPGAEAAKVSEAVAAVLPDGFVARSGDDMAKEIEDQLGTALGFVNVFLLSFAAIALLVASLLIFNTFSILVAQRARELALLRALGAKRRQVRGSVLIEALTVGLVGTTLGLGAGYGLAWGILAVLRGMGMDLGPATPQITVTIIVICYLAGILVTLVAAQLPAWRASRTRPVEAMLTALPTGPESRGRLPWIGIAMIEVGVAVVVCAVWLKVPGPLVWAGMGTVLLVIGMVLSASVVGAPVVWVMGRAFQLVFGEVGRMARLNSVRQPHRTAATAATLMIGLALVSTIAILAASTTGSLRHRLSKDQRGDFIISQITGQPFDVKIAQAVRQIDDVDEAHEFRTGFIRQDDQFTAITGASQETITQATSLTLDGTLTQNGVVLSKKYAEDHRLTLGGVITLSTLDGQRQFNIDGIYEGQATIPIAEIIVSPETFAQFGDTTLVSQLIVFTDHGAGSAAVREALEQATSRTPAVTVADVSQYVEDRVGQFGQVFTILYALLALALVISILGIVNTLGLSVMERTREIGLLRAVGMTRRQLRRMVRLEAVIVAVLGASLGVMLGIVSGSTLVTLLQDQGVDRLDIPWPQLAVFVVVAGVFGILAAVGPARKASRHDVLEAIATQ